MLLTHLCPVLSCPVLSCPVLCVHVCCVHVCRDVFNEKPTEDERVAVQESVGR